MNKHAYIIMAHTNYSQLLKLLACLDDSRNDLYLHLDRKFDLSDRQIDELIDEQAIDMIVERIVND